ncbi:MAG: class I SAM-dependent methyltransferase [Verrucomicrobiota bacterium]
MLNNESHLLASRKNEAEFRKPTARSTVINYLLSYLSRETTYLEIGVRNPNHNFNKIAADHKFSVDPGVEYKENPVDFKLTSDEFFAGMKRGDLLPDTLFDVIFIDGLHLAEQVDRDIANALDHIKDDGFIVMHDCNPPTEYHAREDFGYHFSPAGGYWNGTTWKAFLKWRSNPSVFSCCIDSDWGVGVLSKTKNVGKSTTSLNPFFEFSVLEANREDALNLISFEELKARVEA